MSEQSAKKTWPIYTVAVTAAFGGAYAQPTSSPGAIITPPAAFQGSQPTITTPVPGITPLSTPTEENVRSWINSVEKSSYVDGPNPDPDYSEFWIEMRPADEKVQNWVSTSPLSATLVRKNADGSAMNSRLDVMPFLVKKAGKTGSPFANWSEEVWTEIHGGGDDPFAESFPDSDVEDSRRNGRLTISAREKGQPIPREYYIELLRNIAIKTPPK